MPGNSISGTLPAVISQLDKLHVLLLDSNQLEGTIPPTYLQSPELWRINLVSDPALFTRAINSFVSCTLFTSCTAALMLLSTGLAAPSGKTGAAMLVGYAYPQYLT